METIQTYGNWQLNKYAKTKYFKNGRANLHVEITYCIEHSSTRTLPCDDANRVETGMFWIRTKKEAMAAWKSFKKTHSLGGATLRAELFESTVERTLTLTINDPREGWKYAVDVECKSLDEAIARVKVKRAEHARFQFTLSVASEDGKHGQTFTWKRGRFVSIVTNQPLVMVG